MTIATADAIMNGGNTEMKKADRSNLGYNLSQTLDENRLRLGLPPQRYGDCRIRNITDLLGSIYRPTHSLLEARQSDQFIKQFHYVSPP